MHNHDLQRFASSTTSDSFSYLEWIKLSSLVNENRHYYELITFLASLHDWNPEHLITALPSLSIKVAKLIAAALSQSTALGKVVIT